MDSGAHENIQTKDNQSEDTNFMSCPLCNNLLSKCVTTQCGHSYCDVCLEEHLIFKATCFVCEAEQRPNWRQDIRNQPLRSCFAIDTMISQLQEQGGDADPDARKQQQQQVEKKQQTRLRRRLPNELQIGDRVDVRDADYIWCKGVIRLIVESAKREPVLLIHYEHFDDSKDEAL